MNSSVVLLRLSGHDDCEKCLGRRRRTFSFGHGSLAITLLFLITTVSSSITWSNLYVQATENRQQSNSNTIANKNENNNKNHKPWDKWFMKTKTRHQASNGGSDDQGYEGIEGLELDIPEDSVPPSLTETTDAKPQSHAPLTNAKSAASTGDTKSDPETSNFASGSVQDNNDEDTDDHIVRLKQELIQAKHELEKAYSDLTLLRHDQEQQVEIKKIREQEYEAKRALDAAEASAAADLANLERQQLQLNFEALQSEYKQLQAKIVQDAQLMSDEGLNSKKALSDALTLVSNLKKEKETLERKHKTALEKLQSTMHEKFQQVLAEKDTAIEKEILRRTKEECKKIKCQAESDWQPHLLDWQNRVQILEKNKTLLERDFSVAKRKIETLEKMQAGWAAEKEKAVEAELTKRIKEASKAVEDRLQQKMRQQILDSQRKVQELENEIFALQEKQAKIEHAKAMLEDEHQALIVERGKYIQEEVEKQVSEATTQIANSFDAKLRKEVDEANNRTNALHQEIELLQKRNEVAKKMFSKLKGDYDALLLSQAGQIQEQVSHGIEVAVKEMESQWQRSIDEVLDRERRLKTDLDLLREKHEVYKEEYNQLQERHKLEIQEKEAEFEQAMQKVTKETEDNLKKNLNADQSKVAAMKEEIETLRNDLVEAQRKREELEKLHEEVLSKSDEVVKKLVLDQANAISRKVEGEWEEKMANMKEKLTSTYKSKVRSMKSLALEAEEAHEQAKKDLQLSHANHVANLMKEHEFEVSNLEANIDSLVEEVSKHELESQYWLQTAQVREQKLKDMNEDIQKWEHKFDKRAVFDSTLMVQRAGEHWNAVRNSLHSFLVGKVNSTSAAFSPYAEQANTLYDQHLKSHVDTISSTVRPVYEENFAPHVRTLTRQASDRFLNVHNSVNETSNVLLSIIENQFDSGCRKSLSFLNNLRDKGTPVPNFVLSSLSYICRNSDTMVSSFLKATAVFFLIWFRHLLWKTLIQALLLVPRVLWFFCPLRVLFFSKDPQTNAAVHGVHIEITTNANGSSNLNVPVKNIAMPLSPPIKTTISNTSSASENDKVIKNDKEVEEIGAKTKSDDDAFSLVSSNSEKASKATNDVAPKKVGNGNSSIIDSKSSGDEIQKNTNTKRKSRKKKG